MSSGTLAVLRGQRSVGITDGQGTGRGARAGQRGSDAPGWVERRGRRREPRGPVIRRPCATHARRTADFIDMMHSYCVYYGWPTLGAGTSTLCRHHLHHIGGAHDKPCLRTLLYLSGQLSNTKQHSTRCPHPHVELSSQPNPRSLRNQTLFRAWAGPPGTAGPRAEQQGPTFSLVPRAQRRVGPRSPAFGIPGPEAS